MSVLEDAIPIPGYGADTFYPTEDRMGRLYSGYDDGGVGDTSVNSFTPSCTTGSAIVTGADWRNLHCESVGGAIHEVALPMQGRYTSANFVANETWWIGSYGGSEGDKGCEMGTGVPQLCVMGPFAGFRHSTDQGRNWSEPRAPDGSSLNISKALFGEKAGEAVKYGAPHVVDHGPENIYSPDGYLYMVATGCLASAATSNCSWISGDAIFLTRAKDFDAKRPDSLNDERAWEFWCGDACGYTRDIRKAQPIFAWKEKVGTVTATWHKGLGVYLLAVTTPTEMPSTVGAYDTYVLEAASLTGPFKMVTYLPRFGQQAYFVSFPSKWLDGENAVMTFSANFACKTGGCAPNLRNAGYGANMLPVRFARPGASPALLRGGARGVRGPVTQP